MNTLEGGLGDGGIDTGGGVVPVPPGLGGRLEVGRKLVVGIRPEHLALTPGGQLELAVRAVEWLGHECLVFGTIGGADAVVRQTGMADVRPGDTARVAVEATDVHVFDPETTDRLA
jgi:ABC-type sugar transport system ATPase subunit